MKVLVWLTFGELAHFIKFSSSLILCQSDTLNKFVKLNAAKLISMRFRQTLTTPKLSSFTVARVHNRDELLTVVTLIFTQTFNHHFISL